MKQINISRPVNTCENIQGTFELEQGENIIPLVSPFFLEKVDITGIGGRVGTLSEKTFLTCENFDDAGSGNPEILNEMWKFLNVLNNAVNANIPRNSAADFGAFMDELDAGGIANYDWLKTPSDALCESASSQIEINSMGVTTGLLAKYSRLADNPKINLSRLQIQGENIDGLEFQLVQQNSTDTPQELENEIITQINSMCAPQFNKWTMDRLNIDVFKNQMLNLVITASQATTATITGKIC